MSKKLTPLARPKAIICDVDKVLTNTVSWYDLTEGLGGDVELHFQLYDQYSRGELSLKKAKAAYFAMLEKSHKGKISRKKILDILFKVPIVSESYATLDQLQEQGYRICLISSSNDVFIQMIAERLQISDWYANAHLIFDQGGYWTDFTQRQDEAKLKVEQLQDFLQRHDLSEKDCIAIGDGASDIELFKVIPGIAVNCENEELNSLAWKRVRYFPSIIQILASLK